MSDDELYRNRKRLAAAVAYSGMALVNRMEVFRQECLSILDRTSTSVIRDQDSFRALHRDGKSISIHKDGALPFLRAVQILRQKCADSGKLVSDEYLSGKLLEFVYELSSLERKKMKAELPSRTIALFRELSRLPLQRQVYLIPVMNLRLGKPLKIMRVQLAGLDIQFLQDTATKYGVGFTFPGETPSQAIETLTSQNETPTFALVEVEANDAREGAKLAVQSAEQGLNVLRTVAELSGGDPPFVLRGDYEARMMVQVRHLDVANRGISTENALVNLVASIPALTAAQVDTLASKLAGIEALANKPAENLTDLEGDLIDAIYWFGRGVKEKEPLIKYVMYFIALELLLVQKYQRAKGVTLARNLAGILYDKQPKTEREEVAKTAARLAEIRNNIIHKGEKTVLPEDLNQLEHWTQATILFLLKYTKYPTLDRLIDAEFPLAMKRRGVLNGILGRLHPA